MKRKQSYHYNSYYTIFIIQARNKLINILGMLSQDDDDVMKISSLLDELIDNEKAAEEHYKALLESHPFSIPVLRYYII